MKKFMAIVAFSALSGVVMASAFFVAKVVVYLFNSHDAAATALLLFLGGCVLGNLAIWVYTNVSEYLSHDKEEGNDEA